MLNWMAAYNRAEIVKIVLDEVLGVASKYKLDVTVGVEDGEEFIYVILPRMRRDDAPQIVRELEAATSLPAHRVTSFRLPSGIRIWPQGEPERVQMGDGIPAHPTEIFPEGYEEG